MRGIASEQTCVCRRARRVQRFNMYYVVCTAVAGIGDVKYLFIYFFNNST